MAVQRERERGFEVNGASRRIVHDLDPQLMIESNLFFFLLPDLSCERHVEDIFNFGSKL